ncbi:NADP-dependent oxidoreductase domain-containing protein [Lipomyces arxii]|uniref:NADP-dependent oxidoreductase domain-containing protein n=1 Tax=Lipomyces arxii TaxID=56418 RepID=UPI0034D0120E
MDSEESLPILKKAYDLGVTTWDTANTYSNGESERVIAKAIKTYNLHREELVIMTKCFFSVKKEGDSATFGFADPNTKEYCNTMGLSRAAIFNAVNDSLERLEMDYIDDPNVEPEEVMCALNDLVRSGKVRYIGASSMWAYQFATYQHVAEMNGWTKFVPMQNLYNALYREEELELKFQRPVDYPAGQEIVKRIEGLAKKHGWTMTEVALAWINEKITSPIVGANSIKRLEDTVRASNLQLSADEVSYISEPYVALPITR